MSFKKGARVERADAFSLVKGYQTEYAKEILTERAFQSSIDGLKPVQRAYMWALYLLTGGKDVKIKSQKVCADVIGSYHPHNADAVYLTSVGMAEERASLIKPLSTMSSRVNSQPTASRYTNVQLSELGKELFSTIDLCPMEKSIIDDSPMPTYLLPRFPYQLMNYSSNIGYGYGNTILPLNPTEVMDATIMAAKIRRDGGKITTNDILEYVKGPDLYANHTVYMNSESLYSLIEHGRGFATVVCKLEYDSRKKAIIIRELPYRQKVPKTHALIMGMIIDGAKGKSDTPDKQRLFGFKDKENAPASNENDINLRFDIDTSRGFNYEFCVNELYTKTQLKKGYSIEYFLVGPEGDRLDVVPPRELIEECLDVNIRYYEYKYNKELEVLRKKREENVALEKVTRPENREMFGKIIYMDDKVQQAIEKIGLSQYEAEEIIFKQNVLNKFSQRPKIMRELEEFAAEEARILEKLKFENIMKETITYLEYIKTLVQCERVSEVVDSPVSTISPKIKVIEQPKSMLVTITRDNTISCVPNIPDNEDAIWKEGVRFIYEVSDKDSVMFVCDGSTVKVPVTELHEETTMAAVYGIRSRVLAVVPMPSVPSPEHIWMFVTNNGEVKTTTEEDLYPKIKNTKFVYFKEDERIIDIFRVRADEFDNILIGTASKNGFIRYANANFHPAKGRLSGFVRFTLLKEDDEIVGAFLARKGFGSIPLNIVLENGDLVDYATDEDFFTKPVLNRGNHVFKELKISSLAPKKPLDIVDDMVYIDSGKVYHQITIVNEEEVV